MDPALDVSSSSSCTLRHPDRGASCSSLVASNFSFSLLQSHFRVWYKSRAGLVRSETSIKLSLNNPTLAKKKKKKKKKEKKKKKNTVPGARGLLTSHLASSRPSLDQLQV